MYASRSALRALAADLAIVDFNAIMRQLNALEPSESASRTMIAQALRALDQADDIAVHAADTPGEQRKRDEARAHLLYYREDHPEQIVTGFYDIRKWTIQAFILYNAAVEVDQQAIFWPSVLEALQEAPSLIGRILGTVAAGAGEVAGEGFLGVLKGFLFSPIGAAVAIGGTYLLLRRRSS